MPTTGSVFDDSSLAAPEKCMFVTGMVIYIRRWDDRPVIGGICQISVMCLNLAVLPLKMCDLLTNVWCFCFINTALQLSRNANLHHAERALC